MGDRDLIAQSVEFAEEPVRASCWMRVMGLEVVGAEVRVADAVGGDVPVGVEDRASDRDEYLFLAAAAGHASVAGGKGSVRAAHGGHWLRGASDHRRGCDQRNVCRRIRCSPNISPPMKTKSAEVAKRVTSATVSAIRTPATHSPDTRDAHQPLAPDRAVLFLNPRGVRARIPRMPSVWDGGYRS
jgi:hypothetical protein